MPVIDRAFRWFRINDAEHEVVAAATSGSAPIAQRSSMLLGRSAVALIAQNAQTTCLD